MTESENTPDFKPQIKQLSALDLAHIELIQERLARASAIYGLRQKDMELEAKEQLIHQLKHENRVLKSQGELKQLEQDINASRRAYLNTRDQMSKKYGVDFAQCTYDSDTGIIHEPQPPLVEESN